MNEPLPARADEVRDVAPEDPLPLLSDAVVRAIEPKLCRLSVGFTISQNIRFVIFAIAPNSFPRGFVVIVCLILSLTCLTVPSLGNRLLLTT